jgi:MerR family transcriptional regulator, light-induced transcriptional regulator
MQIGRQPSFRCVCLLRGESFGDWSGGTDMMRSKRDMPVATEATDLTKKPIKDGDTAKATSTDMDPSALASEKVIYLAHAALQLLAGETSKRRRNAPLATDHCLNAFCTLLQSGRMAPALNFTSMFARRGADYEDIAENLFAAAARRMGDRWLTDQASWVDVNIGSSTLTRTHIAFRSMLKQHPPVVEASAIFGSFVGQAHILGLSFATEYFRRNGWNVRHLPGAKQDAFITTVAGEAPDIVGLTAATESDLEILHGVIEQLRKIPSSPRIIVGGSSPDLACLNADAVVSRLDMGLWAGHRLLA